MGRYYGGYNDSGCGCIGVVIVAIFYIIGFFVNVYDKLNNAGQIYMITSVISFTCICFSVWSWLKRKEKKKEAFEADMRAKQKGIENLELVRKNRKLEMSEKCAWETVNKERNALLVAHNKQETEFQNRINKLELEYKRKEENCISKTESRKRELELEYKILKVKCNRQVEDFRNATKSSTPFKYTSVMYANLEMCIFKDVEKWMLNKKQPAKSSAEIVKELRQKSKEYIIQYKQMQYKYNYLLSVFPELKSYVEDEESLLHLSDFKDFDEFSDNRDRVHDWVSDEEYSRMSEDDRNQLALERYKSRKKSNWEIGMEYEMYIGHVLRKDKFYIKQFGIENGLNDLGRDIIAEKAHLDGSRSIYIIQCKNWSKDKELHENVVCQLFGTTLEYQIKHRDLFNTKVVPLLVATTELSDTAKEFAKRLGVVWKIVEMGEYPMIKCNINNGNKIYHLPFDQQYYNTKITEYTGESYEWTVKDATRKGFRRAMKWRGNI